MTNNLKKTPLFDKHVSLGGKIVEFAGWNMPVQFSGLVDEHNNVRTKVGIFDVSHMGTFRISGKNAFNFLQRMVPNDLNKITFGKAIYTQICNDQGKVLDDLIIYYIEENLFYMVVNASNVDKDFKWLNDHLTEENVKLENIAENHAVLAIQGPYAEKTLSKIINYDLSTIGTFNLIRTTLENTECIVSRTGYTGEDGFELIFDNKNVLTIYEKILSAGEEFGIKPIGLGARDTLRLEANLPLYGHELDENTTPIEARLTWSVKLDKADFMGKNALIDQKEKGLHKKLIGLKTLSRAVPRDGYEVVYNNEVIGKVTSGTFSPTLNYPIALAFIKAEIELKKGDKIEISIRGKNHEAEIVSLPFYKRNRSI